ncbi:MAG: HEPN domain-containing protein [Thermoplasmata archaeon]
MELARSYLRMSRARLSDSREALQDKIYPYALRLAQECTEMSLKAALRMVAIEYPKKHDVSDVLLQSEKRFPEWFQKEIAFMAEGSRKLAKKREISMYGDEVSALSPDVVISGEEAREAVQIAEKTLRMCRKLLREIP